ncbi:hypothetical protein BKN97_002890 [Escherichia coli]|nr:hypothetical protein [Escherichia coli]
MNSHNITNESLALALMLVVVAILISHKEKLALEKDIFWSVGRAIIQLIFAGIDPVKAIKYQIMVTFMLLSTASLSTIIACYLTYRKFYNSRHQLVVTQLKKK